MRPVVDIISDVVTSMKPTISALAAVISGGGATVTVGDMSAPTLNKLFVGERIKCTFSGNVVYGTIASIASDSFIITLDSSRAVPPTALEVVLNYHHGHLKEIRNTFRLWTQKGSVKKEQFPALIVIQDFPEKVDVKQHTREATLRVIILTDSKQSFSAGERYTNTIEPILYPLEDLFFSQLKASTEVQGYGVNYTRYDRLFWGRQENQEGTATNIFNDYIDAIEIENLNLKILNTC